MDKLLRRLRYLLNRRRFDDELANDLEFHREMAALAGGKPVGDPLRLREEARDAWGWTWIDRLGQDLRYATRLLRKSPGFTLSAILILAVGIGANVAAFGFFNLMVLRPLPVRDPATLLHFQRQAPAGYASVLPYPEFDFFRRHTTTLSALIARSRASVQMAGDDKPLKAHFVSANFFTELGASASLGRLLDPTRDEAAGADPVVVLSRGFWQRRFGADASLPGRIIHLNGKPVTVIGVASDESSSLALETPDLWIPVTQHPHLVSGSKLLTDFSVETAGEEVWGRLKQGLTPKAAEDELRALAATLRAEHPEGIWENETLPSEPGGYVTSILGRAHHGTGAKDPSEILPVASLIAALVLLILAVACGNLGSLLLARGVAREREISIRVSVGAGSARLIRQLLTESALLGLLGSAAGLGVGYLIMRGLMSVTSTPLWLDPSPDWRVLLFCASMGLFSALLFGVTPAFQVVRQRHRATRTRQILISAQVAASCVLLIVAGLLVRALTHASSDPGFEYRQVVTINPELGNHNYSAAQARTYLDTLQGRLRNLPGIDAISTSSAPPFGNKTISIRAEFDGRAVSIRANNIDPQYFETLRIPLHRGRNLTAGDTHSLVISQSLAELAWPGADPLGKPLDLAGNRYTIVGIAANAHVTSQQDKAAAEAYFLAVEADLPSMVLLVRTSASPESLVPTLSSLAKAVDPNVMPDVQLMKNSFQRRLQGTQYGVLSVSILAAIALFLACLGIAGLIAYAVSQRTKEIGIRMALGAKPADVVLIVMRQFARPLGIGLVIGAAAAAALAQVLRKVLFGLGPLDPVAYFSAIGLFTLTVALASLFPARKALRIDPMQALRND
ncbi:ABC transporter permease [Paludibaculum fermentans]|uniref:ABC transporter permease n=1 Tax=Paludibaculum fermentans TaxID=1473598 RepID=UPI003EB97188